MTRRTTVATTRLHERMAFGERWRERLLLVVLGTYDRRHEADAIVELSPRPEDGVVAWDGAVGRFAPEEASRRSAKIGNARAPGRASFGSESLGHEGSDHPQFFETLSDLHERLAGQFPRVPLREEQYESGDGSEAGPCVARVRH